VTKERLHRFEKWLGLQHHSLAAAKWPVIHGAMAILRERTQILYVHLDERRLARAPQDPVIKRSGKELWEYGDEVKSHR
jgi:hypothetical protein